MANRRSAWSDAETMQRTVARLPWRRNMALIDPVDATICGGGQPTSGAAGAGLSEGSTV